jgi:hypothetical protein
MDEWPSETYQLGELLYVVEKSSMALCRVVRIAPCKEIPEGTNYTLQIIEQPYDDDHKYFKVLAYLNPFLLFYNRFTVCVGPIYSPYGAHWYRPEWFDHFYGDYHVKMERWSWAPAIILAIAVIVVLACCIAGAVLILP